MAAAHSGLFLPGPPWSPLAFLALHWATPKTQCLCLSSYSCEIWGGQVPSAGEPQASAGSVPRGHAC